MGMSVVMTWTIGAISYKCLTKFRDPKTKWSHPLLQGLGFARASGSDARAPINANVSGGGVARVQSTSFGSM